MCNHPVTSSKKTKQEITKYSVKLRKTFVLRRSVESINFLTFSLNKVRLCWQARRNRQAVNTEELFYSTWFSPPQPHTGASVEYSPNLLTHVGTSAYVRRDHANDGGHFLSDRGGSRKRREDAGDELQPVEEPMEAWRHRLGSGRKGCTAIQCLQVTRLFQASHGRKSDVTRLKTSMDHQKPVCVCVCQSAPGEIYGIITHSSEKIPWIH